jgi:hypothetical protein
MVLGTSKLDEEYESARNIPEKERYIVDKKYL